MRGSSCDLIGAAARDNNSAERETLVGTPGINQYSVGKVPTETHIKIWASATTALLQPGAQGNSLINPHSVINVLILTWTASRASEARDDDF